MSYDYQEIKLTVFGTNMIRYPKQNKKFLDKIANYEHKFVSQADLKIYYCGASYSVSWPGSIINYN